jgi:hypothetical protein
LPSAHVLYRLKDISPQIAFACEFLKFLKVLSELMNLTATLRDQISQSPEEEITFGPEPLHLAFVASPLITYISSTCRISWSTCQAKRRLCSLGIEACTRRDSNSEPSDP